MRGLAALQKAPSSFGLPPIARYPPPKSFIAESMPRTTRRAPHPQPWSVAAGDEAFS